MAANLSNSTLVNNNLFHGFSNSTVSNSTRNSRIEKRVILKLTLYARRLINTSLYGRPVKVINVSRSGVAIHCNVNLEIGAVIELTNARRTFTAQATVRHSEPTEGGGYQIGLSIEQISGGWVIK